MRDAQPRTIHLRDYRPPPFTITRAELHIELFDEHALVHANLAFIRAADTAADATLELQGEDLELLFTAPASADAAVREIVERSACQITRIGEVTEVKAVEWERAGQICADPLKLFRHF